MKLLVDMNLSPRWVGFLTQHVIQAVHWSSVGEIDALDAEIMAYAREHGYVVLTHDLDFGAILAATQGAGPSVVQIRAEEVSPELIGMQILAALEQMRGELEEGALLTIHPKHARLRVLPLRIRGG
jgi:predicted nuclease of predicted toxin-antitoxin system